MPKTMQVVRGNLAAAPTYWKASTAADGSAKPAYLTATVYEDRRIRQQDGSWIDNPAGPTKTTVKFWGASADILAAQNYRQGDAVVVTGRVGEPDAYISDKDHQAHARQVILGDSMQIDTITMSRRAERARQREQQQTQQAGMQQAPAAQQQPVAQQPSPAFQQPPAQQPPVQDEFGGSFDQTDDDPWNLPQSAPSMTR